MIMPQYLSGFAKNVKSSKTSITFDIFCPCGCNRFLIYENVPCEEDQDAKDRLETLLKGRFDGSGVSMFSDKDGNVFIVKKNFFGRTVYKEKLNDVSFHRDTKVFKARCDGCGNEFILFDNRIHGYDAFIEKKKVSEVDFLQRRFKGSIDNMVNLNMKIFNDHISLDEFNSDGDVKATSEEFSNAFSDITINGFIIDLNNKRVTIHSEETA